jgi:hypothetical protein
VPAANSGSQGGGAAPAAGLVPVWICQFSSGFPFTLLSDLNEPSIVIINKYQNSTVGR